MLKSPSKCRMYIAAVRIAADYGCEAIGIQYQQGLKDLCAASDLVEGILNNVDRPPVRGKSGEILFEGKAVVHFNEVDECAGVDVDSSPIVSGRSWDSIRRRRCMMSGGASRMGTNTSGSFLSRARFRRSIWSAAMRAPIACDSRRCISPMEAGRSAASASQANWVWSSYLCGGCSVLKADIKAREGNRVACRGNETAMGSDNGAMADHARGALWRVARSTDGQASVEPYSGRLWRQYRGRSRRSR